MRIGVQRDRKHNEDDQSYAKYFLGVEEEEKPDEFLFDLSELASRSSRKSRLYKTRCRQNDRKVFYSSLSCFTNDYSI